MPLDGTTELGRLNALRRCGVLDSEPEVAFDRITGLAAGVVNAPVAVISFVDGSRVWYKSIHGSMPSSEVERIPGFCNTVVVEKGPHVVLHASGDRSSRDHPYVTGEMGVEFYVGVPLTSPSGHVIGTLACFDTKPRESGVEHIHSLEALAAIVMNEIELRRSAAQILTLSEALAASCQDMERRAGFDPLTGVLTRAAVLERSEKLISRARSGMSGVAVLLLDVDRVQFINDTYGRAAGDRVLREVATRLVRLCRGHDPVGRIGGDRFMAVFSDVTFEQSKGIANRLREGVCRSPVPLSTGRTQIDVAVSGGLLYVPATDAPFSMEDAVRVAGDSLVKAKQDGRNAIALAYRPET